MPLVQYSVEAEAKGGRKTGIKSFDFTKCDYFENVESNLSKDYLKSAVSLKITKHFLILKEHIFDRFLKRSASIQRTS